MIKCISYKKVYLTPEIAEEALIGARTHYDYSEGRGPVGIYQCEDCGHYHLTSKGPMNQKLEKFIKEGDLRRHKEADRWLDKFKKR